MRTRQSSNDDAMTPQKTTDGDFGNGPSALAREGNDLLSLSDDIIRRSLSGQSEAFVNANRQQGGQ